MCFRHAWQIREWHRLSMLGSTLSSLPEFLCSGFLKRTAHF